VAAAAATAFVMRTIGTFGMRSEGRTAIVAGRHAADHGMNPHHGLLQ
jgi:hypothetical protein